MSLYEIDDAVVTEFVSNYRHRFHQDAANATEPMLAELLGKQLRLPVPTKVSAIVRTQNGATWTLAACGNHWISQHDVGGEHVTRTKAEMASSLIAEVLFEGVDL